MNDYKEIKKEELENMIHLHELWLDGTKGGQRADFSNMNLSKLDLSKLNLSRAIFKGAVLIKTSLIKTDLEGAQFTNCNLNEADLSYANVDWADFRKANLDKANLYQTSFQRTNFCNASLIEANLLFANLYKTTIADANLNSAILFGANLSSADLSDSNLNKADIRKANFCKAFLSNTILTDVIFDETTLCFGMECPEEGSFIGYKKAQNKIVVLEIPADAERSSATTKKCRCSKAKVLRIEEMDGSISKVKSVHSDWNEKFVYELGKTAIVYDYNVNRWNECSMGIHFFMNKEVAKQYGN